MTTKLTFSGEAVRPLFPSLQSGAVFFDNPGGTQVPQMVIDAVSDYYKTANSNTHGAFATSLRTDETIAMARAAMADFLNASSTKEIIFGPNMTSLTFHTSRSIGRLLKKGDEIIVTRLDHDANIAPWLALEEQGAVVRWVDISPEDCTLNYTNLKNFLNKKTKIVAVGYASNAVGTINDLRAIIDHAHQVDAYIFVDAVHYAPHGPIDVQALDCDFLACSAYKFFGPHVGVLYGKYDLLNQLPAYKVRPAENVPPEKFETGTQNHEALAGIIAAVNYLAFIGKCYGSNFKTHFESFKGRRLHLKTAMTTIKAYERHLFTRLMRELGKIPGIKLYGIADPARFDERTPTIMFTKKRHSPRQIAELLGQQDIYVWDGNYYALAVIERLGLEEHGGAVRVGLAHYNTNTEVDRFLSALKKI